MNEIYNGKYLTIKHNKEKSLFIQNWGVSPKNEDVFKIEMLEYTKLYKEFHPKHTLWHQQNFSLLINDDLKNWIEINVNKPCFKYGNEKCAFVVAQDVLAHIETIDVFEKTNSSINARHFASSDEAQKWFDEKESKSIYLDYNLHKSEITYKGLDVNDNVIIEFKNSPSEITNTLKSIKNIFEDNKFIQDNVNKYSSLTNREREVLKLLTERHTNSQIADLMVISINTVRTHRNNIWKKLNIKHLSDCIKYECFFNSSF